MYRTEATHGPKLVGQTYCDFSGATARALVIATHTANDVADLRQGVLQDV